MALKKPTNAVPAYEVEEDLVDDVQVENEVVTEDAPQVEDTPTQAQPLPVAATQSKALTAVGNKFQTAFNSYRNSIDLETVAEVGQGNMPKLVADRGGFELEGKSYGDHITIELVSFNERFVLTPGVDGEEAKKLLKYSYDGLTVADEPGLQVRDYIDYLKSEGYGKADAKKYIDLWALIVSSEKGGEIADEDRELVQVQLSPSSVREWNKMQLQASVKVSRTKRELSPFLKLTIDKREFGTNKFAAIKFTLA